MSHRAHEPAGSRKDHQEIEQGHSHYPGCSPWFLIPAQVNGDGRKGYRQENEPDQIRLLKVRMKGSTTKAQRHKGSPRKSFFVPWRAKEQIYSFSVPPCVLGVFVVNLLLYPKLLLFWIN
jgi:hypothetical protein